MAAGAAPELPALGEILAAAFLFLAWAVCIGVLWAYRRSLKRVIVGFANLLDVSVLGRHPLGGVSAWLKAQAQNIDHLLGEAALASERGAVVLFKLFLNLQVWIAHEIAALATDVWHAGVGVGKRLTKLEVAAVSHISGGVSRFVHAVVTKAIAVERKVYDRSFHRTDSRIGALEHYVHGKTWAGFESGTFAPAQPHAHAPSLADQIAAPWGRTAKQLRRLGRRVGKLEDRTVGLGAVALVTAAALRMGFKWIKCDAAKSVGRRLNCGSFRFLESLLSLVVDSLVITHLCATTKLLTRLAYDVLPVVSALTHGVEKLMECQGATRAPDMKLNAAALPALDTSRIPI